MLHDRQSRKQRSETCHQTQSAETVPLVGVAVSVPEPSESKIDQVQRERRTAFRSIPAWAAVVPVFAIWCGIFAGVIGNGFAAIPDTITATVWFAATILHVPYILLIILFASGVRERIGYFIHARKPKPGGAMPRLLPKVCIQLPMFNEQAVARRIIASTAAIEWPRDRFEIQVLDDSTETDTRDMVRAYCAELSEQTGTTIDFIHRTDRSGYKAGALEAGRKQTDAEFIAIFDADFLPPSDYLHRAVPHFFDGNSHPLPDLALVQGQWGHLNDDESPLTEAQALWVDDHHTLQQSWRSAVLDFVNFTGTAGLWRASAIEAAGGWSSSSLVEDCELSFRTLFAGYRTKFVKELVVPAELPQTIAAYRSQQKRWTQGWAQLQRLHFNRLLTAFPAGFSRKSGLLAMMCISWQWPLWFIWIAIFPFLLANGLSVAVFGADVALIVYLAPPLVFALASGLAATIEARLSYTQPDGNLRISVARRVLRVVPNLIVNAGMLPHHFCAFIEGLFGPMHAEFERTPKTAQVTVRSASAAAATPVTKPKATGRVARPGYAAVEMCFIITQLLWIAAFFNADFMLATLASLWLVTGIAILRLSPWVSAFARKLRGRFHTSEAGR